MILCSILLLVAGGAVAYNNWQNFKLSDINDIITFINSVSTEIEDHKDWYAFYDLNPASQIPLFSVWDSFNATKYNNIVSAINKNSQLISQMSIENGPFPSSFTDFPSLKNWDLLTASIFDSINTQVNSQGIHARYFNSILCWVDRYRSFLWDWCTLVEDGFYSVEDNNNRFECTNGPSINSTYISPWNWEDACDWVCNPTFNEYAISSTSERDSNICRCWIYEYKWSSLNCETVPIWAYSPDIDDNKYDCTLWTPKGVEGAKIVVKPAGASWVIGDYEWTSALSACKWQCNDTFELKDTSGAWYYSCLCWLDKYLDTSTNTCKDVGIGYYSQEDSNDRVQCRNKASYSYYTSSWWWESSCEYACNDTMIPFTSDWILRCWCWVDKYANSSWECIWVWDGYYSLNLSTIRFSCSGLPSKAYFTSEWGGENNCDWSCVDWFSRSWDVCIPTCITDSEQNLLNSAFGTWRSKYTWCTLTSLSWSNKWMTSIPNAIWKLPKLKSLYLSNNNITYIPSWMITWSNLPQLRYLYLSWNSWLWDLSYNFTYYSAVERSNWSNRITTDRTRIRIYND